MSKKVSILLFLLLSFHPALSVSLPDGIRGVAQSYGPWLEKLLENTPLKNLFGEENMKAYREYQRILLYSERAAEENSPAEALSYLRKAKFLLRDIERDILLTFDWQTLDDRIATIAALNEEEALALTTYLGQKAHLFLQYEYYYNYFDDGFEQSRDYFNRAQKLIQLIPEKSFVKKQTDKTELNAYLKALGDLYLLQTQDKEQYISNAAVILKKAVRKLNLEKDYWGQKLLKRAVLFLAANGHIKEALDIYNDLGKATDVFPDSFKIALWVNKGLLPMAQNYLLEKIKNKDLSDQNNWGEYILSANRYWNLLYLENNPLKLKNFTQEYIDRLASFLNNHYLTTEVYGFLENEKFKFQLRLEQLRGYPDSEVKIKTPLSMNEETKQHYEIYRAITENKSSSLPAAVFFNLQKAVFEKQFDQASRLLKQLKKESPASYAGMAELLIAVNNPEYRAGESQWYSLWEKAIRNAAFIPPMSFLFTEGYGASVDFESLFQHFIKEKSKGFSAAFKQKLVRLIDFRQNWFHRAKYPPVYFKENEQRMRYEFISSYEIRIPRNTSLQLQPAAFQDAGDICEENTLCWTVLPVANGFYSLILLKDKILHEDFSDSRREVFQLLHSFYNELENDASLDTLKRILKTVSLAFPMDVIEDTARKQNLKVKITPLQNAHIIPFEALLLKNDSYLSESFFTVRKLPVDIFTKNFHCLENCAEAGKENSPDHVFIGIGTRRGRMLFDSAEQGDEIMEVENLFREKYLIYDGGNLARELLEALEISRNRILHIAGEWEAGADPGLTIRNNEEAFRLDMLRDKFILPYVVVSLQRVNTFNTPDYTLLTDLLETFRYKNTSIMILSLAPTPKVFRQAFFYNLYYQLEHKQKSWEESFRSSLIRTQKEFTNNIWSFLMVYYEK